MAPSPLDDNAQARRLIRLYDEGEKEILREVNRLLLKSPESYSLSWQKTVLARVREIRAQLLAGGKTWTGEAISASYMKGVEWADKDPLSGNQVLAGFGKIHTEAVNVLAENTYSRLVDVDTVIGRKTEDVFRQVALENVRGSVIGYQTTKQAAKRIREELSGRGITGFTAKNGVEWNLSRYAKMLAQESTNQSFRAGTINRLESKGHDLVRISTHSGSCPKCTPWEGRTLSLSGTDPDHPSLDEAKSAGLMHVGCLHVISLAPEERDRFIGRLQGKEGEAARQAEITRLAEKAGWKNPIKEASPEEFIKQRDKLPKDKKPFLTQYASNEYKAAGVKLKLHESGNGGYGLKGDELISVFSLPGAHLGNQVVQDAVANGAKRLDCLGKRLVTLYRQNGFKVVKIDKWDEKYAPNDWDYAKHGKPDLYYMELK